jgi:hypothetical protein
VVTTFQRRRAVTWLRVTRHVSERLYRVEQLAVGGASDAVRRGAKR